MHKHEQTMYVEQTCTNMYKLAETYTKFHRNFFIQILLFRWKQKPFEEAVRFGHLKVATYIKVYIKDHPEQSLIRFLDSKSKIKIQKVCPECFFNNTTNNWHFWCAKWSLAVFA